MKFISKIFILLLTINFLTTGIHAQKAALTEGNSAYTEAEIAAFISQHKPSFADPASKSANAVGDDCSNPFTATLGMGDTYNDTDQTTCGRGNSYNIHWSQGGEDCMYQLEITEPLSLNIAIDPQGTSNSVVSVYDACPDVGNEVIVNYDWNGSTWNFDVVLTPGTYYLMVDYMVFGGDGCLPLYTLDLTTSSVPPGDACFTAFDYGFINDAAIDGTITSGMDVDWYMFTADDVDRLTTVSLCNSSPYTNTKLEVWTDCGDGTYTYYNDDACSSASEITDIVVPAGETYYAKVYTWSYGYGDYTIDITGLDMTPRLNLSPTTLDLGEWPIAGWQESEYFTLSNQGAIDISFNDSDLDDANDVFTLYNPAIPSIITPGSSELVGVAFEADGVAEGTYNATYVASFGAAKSVLTADISVDAYDAPLGDIVENPFIVSLPHVDAGVSSAFPMRSNYNTPGTATNGNDVVYMFTLAEDKELDVTITNATETPKMAIYAAGFDGEGGPMVLNAVAASGATATDVPLFAGDYYLVVSCEADDAAMTFDIAIGATTMPDPECAMNEMPSDGAIDIPSNGLTLSWDYGMYAQEYQVMFGTTYPPTTELVSWTAVEGTGGSYALPNLDPAMQYFWQVNVRNNNATVICGVWGFTTTLTPPSDLTATVQMVAGDENDYNVVLNWTSSAKALLGYNVYRDGAVINASLVTTNTYTDFSVPYNMNPCYEYQVEAIFDEGVSSMSNVANACVTGTGTLNGLVTALLTGEPIANASISLVSQMGGSNYELSSDLMGEYSAEVLEDCYTLTVSATGFSTEIRENVCVDYNTITTEDFMLDEYPFPVTYVVATENSDNIVNVEWGGATGDVIADWIFYDDGTYETSIGGVPGAFMWAIKFDPDQLEDYGGCSISKFQAYISSSMTMDFMVMQGENAENVIYSETIDALSFQWGEWNEIELLTPVSFNHTEPLWIAFLSTTPYSYPAAVGPGQGEPNGDLISTDGITWEHLSDIGFDNTWNLRGFVTNQSGKSMQLGNNIYSKNRVSFTEDAEFDLKTNNSDRNPATASLPGTIDPASKSLLGYNVYRQVCNEASPMEFLGMTLDEEYTDNTWGNVEWGTYKWAVEAIYTNTVSEAIYSNCLDKDMETTVGVEVTTNSGDAPEGCQVLFSNTSEPDLELFYDIDLDATGMATIEPFRKGVYDILVSLPGFTQISVSDVLVDSDMVFVWQLDEILAPPTDFYVTPTGLATWIPGADVQFQPLYEDFESGDIPEGWTATANDEPGWFVTLNGSSGWYIPAGDGYYACSNDDANDDDSSMDYLISPVQNLSSCDEPTLSFNSFFTGQYDQRAYIEVSVDDGPWVVVQEFYGGSFDWVTEVVDLMDYAGESNVRIAFHASDFGYWGSGWAVDNVALTDGLGKKSTKGFQFYKIWHDGTFSNDVDTTFYQYGANSEVDILVPGETYIAEVATLYSTGLSETTTYEWTYLPCDSFPSWESYDAYNIDGSNDNLVNWTPEVPPTPTFTPITEDFESGYLSEGWSMTTNSNLGWFITPDGSGWEWWIPWTGSFYACSNDTYGQDDGSMDYLISPEMSFIGVPNVEITFSSYFTGDNGQTATLEVSTDGGDSWTVVEEMTPTTNWQWEEVNVDLSDYTGEPSVLVGFHSNDNNGAGSGWAVDDVSIDVFEPADGIVQVIGTNVYRDGEMLAFVAESDTFYLDMNLEPGYYDYCIANVYSKMKDFIAGHLVKMDLAFLMYW